MANAPGAEESYIAKAQQLLGTKAARYKAAGVLIATGIVVSLGVSYKIYTGETNTSVAPSGPTPTPVIYTRDTKSAVTGEVFIVRNDGGSIKMGLVDVYAFPSELWDKCLSNQGGNIASAAQIIAVLLEKIESMRNTNSEKLAELRRVLTELRSLEEMESNNAHKFAGLGDYSNAHKSLQGVKQTALDILKTQRAIAEREVVASKGTEALAEAKDTYNKIKRGENISGLLNQCAAVPPLGKVATNADGKFTLDWTSSKNVQLNEVLSGGKEPQKLFCSPSHLG